MDTNPRPTGTLRRSITLSAVLASLGSGVARAQSTSPDYEILIRGGLVLDGTGADGRVADVAIRNGRIAAVGDLADASAARVIDASGLVVAPGFIDVHSHADWGFGQPGLNLAVNNLTQGIATVVVGQDGRSAWPVGGRIRQSIDLWMSQGLTQNVILLAGHGSVRREVMGDDARRPTRAELARMRELVRQAMEGGAFGLSTGLSYVPGRFATTEEVIALAREIAPYSGVYISHLRDQGAGLVESVRETVRVGREASVTVVATHFKVSGRENFRTSAQALQVIEEARRQGVAIFTDQYPYTTSSNGIDVSFLPPSFYGLADGGAALTRIHRSTPQELVEVILGSDDLAPKLYTRAWLINRPRPELERRAAAYALSAARRTDPRARAALAALLDDPAQREILRRAVADEIARWGGPYTYVIERAPDPRLEGLTLKQAAELLDLSPAEVALSLELGDAQVTQFHLAETDVELILSRDFNATSSDGTVPPFGLGVPHPRSYGAFPRKIRRYVIERRLLSLPFAIRSMTGLAAEILGRTDRGILRAGAWADVVIFDLGGIRDRATYRDPHRYSEGIELLLLNGVAVLERGRPTGARPGVVITPRGVIGPRAASPSAAR